MLVDGSANATQADWTGQVVSNVNELPDEYEVKHITDADETAWRFRFPVRFYALPEDVGSDVVIQFVSNPDPTIHDEFGSTTYDPVSERWTISLADNLEDQGKPFFQETVAHEMGHVLADELTRHLPGFTDEMASLFGRAGDAWNDHGEPWEHRITENAAEFFKDVALTKAGDLHVTANNILVTDFNFTVEDARALILSALPFRRGDYRTQTRFPKPSFDRWRELFVDDLYCVDFKTDSILGGSVSNTIINGWVFIPGTGWVNTGAAPSGLMDRHADSNFGPTWGENFLTQGPPAKGSTVMIESDLRHTSPYGGWNGDLNTDAADPYKPWFRIITQWWGTVSGVAPGFPFDLGGAGAPYVKVWAVVSDPAGIVNVAGFPTIVDYIGQLDAAQGVTSEILTNPDWSMDLTVPFYGDLLSPSDFVGLGIVWTWHSIPNPDSVVTDLRFTRDDPRMPWEWPVSCSQPPSPWHAYPNYPYAGVPGSAAIGIGPQGRKVKGTARHEHRLSRADVIRGSAR